MAESDSTTETFVMRQSLNRAKEEIGATVKLQALTSTRDFLEVRNV